MRRSGVAVAAAVMLSMIPVAPAALAAPFSFNPAGITSDSGLVLEVHHRRKVRRHCREDFYRPECRRNFSRNFYYRHDFRRHHRHHFNGGCIWFGGIRICF